MSEKEISYDVIQNIGIVSKTKTYEKRLQILSWNGREPAFDLRTWKIGADKTKKDTALKGITLTKEELLELRKLLSHIDLEV